MEQTRTQSQSFMRGAMLITLSAFISRALGGLYQPIAQYFLGDTGLAPTNAPNSAYLVIFAVSSVGLNVAVSRLIAERLALGDERGARRAFQVSSRLLTMSGLGFALLFAVASPWLSRALHYPDALPGFLILAPAIFLVAQLGIYRGLYQGMQQMAPSAVSQVLEQVGRVVIGAIAIGVLSKVSLSYGAAAFNGGSTVGVLIGAVYTVWIYFRDKPTDHWNTVAPGVESLADQPTSHVVRRIIEVALPLSLIGAILPLMQMVDSVVVTGRLLAAGVAETQAREALTFLSNVSSFRDLPSILTVALYTSLVPAITESYVTGRLEQARDRSAAALRLTYLVGLPATVGLAAGAQEIYHILFRGEGWVALAPLAWSALFLMIQQTTSGALQGMGLIWLCLVNLFIGVAVKIGLTYFLTTASLQSAGAAYATTVGVAVTAVLNLLLMKKRIGFSIRLKEDALRPAVAAAMMGAGMWISSPFLHRFIHGSRLPGVGIVAVGGLIYFVAILAIGGVKEADLLLLPGVRPRMVAALKRYRLLRG